MQIALTKKLVDALEVKLPAVDETVSPLFTWTANWTRVWSNRKTDDMLVLVNNATRFTAAVYQVKRKDLKNAAEKMKNAIYNTLLSMNLNPELVNEYMRLSGDVCFVRNNNRQTASWVTKAGSDCAYFVANNYNGIVKMYSDTLGVSVNHRIVNYSGDFKDAFHPYKAMAEALTELTGMQTYKCRAFELTVTLDLEVYTAERRIIVPANMDFTRFHKVLQRIFSWSDHHLFDFKVFDEKTGETICRMVQSEEDIEYDESAILMDGHILAEFFPEHKQMRYTYDFGDNWEHIIRLVRVIEEYDGELPYLLEASGQTPPEDVGGVSGFISLREIMLDPGHPDYEGMKRWSEYWTPELSEWKKRPGVILL